MLFKINVLARTWQVSQLSNFGWRNYCKYVPRNLRKGGKIMKAAKILLTVLFTVFLLVVTVSAGTNTDPVPTVPPAPGPVPPAPIPEPSILVLLGMGLAAGGAYSFFRHQKSKDRE